MPALSFHCVPRLLAALLLGSSLAAAQPAPVPAPPSGLATVTVRGTRDPVAKSYRQMLHGMEVFEQFRALAPQGLLRYKLLPRSREVSMDGIVLKLTGDSFSQPLAIAPDHTFTLERNALALAEDASVMPNRKAGSMTWRTEVRSPGVPDGMRRLGDLRLECRVGMAAHLVSEDPPLLAMVGQLVARLVDVCKGEGGQYLLFAERPLFGVTMVWGNRREDLASQQLYMDMLQHPVSGRELAYLDSQALLDRTYVLPLGDASWPDDTLIAFDYMDDLHPPRGSAAAKAAP